MRWILLPIAVVNGVALVAWLGAVGALWSKDRSRARRLARGVFIVSSVSCAVLSLSLVAVAASPAIALRVLVPQTLDSSGIDPSQVARALAEAISDVMNAAAFAGLVAVPSGATWWFARS